MSRKTKKAKAEKLAVATSETTVENNVVETVETAPETTPVETVETSTATIEGEEKGIPETVLSRYRKITEGFERKTAFPNNKMGQDSRASFIIACAVMHQLGVNKFTLGDCFRLVQSVNGVNLFLRKIDRTPTSAPNFFRKAIDRIACAPDKDLGYLKQWAQPQCFDKDDRVYHETGFFYAMSGIEYPVPEQSELRASCDLLCREQ